MEKLKRVQFFSMGNGVDRYFGFNGRVTRNSFYILFYIYSLLQTQGPYKICIEHKNNKNIGQISSVHLLILSIKSAVKVPMCTSCVYARHVYTQCVYVMLMCVSIDVSKSVFFSSIYMYKKKI